MNASLVMQSFRFTALLLAFCMAGCASQQARQDLDVTQFLHDDFLPESKNHHVESAQEVFSLDEKAQNQLDTQIGHLRLPIVRNWTLISEIILQTVAAVSYDSHATTTASATFTTRAANCLSLSILAYAMAEHLGYDATFQQVDIPEYWERRGNHNVVAGHINMKIRRIDPDNEPGATLISESLLVDFFSPGSSASFESRPIPRSTVLAMYYNNKGVDALFANNDSKAYAYFRAALLKDPSLYIAASNLAALYMKNGKVQWAEQNYREVVRLNPESTVSSAGLANVLMKTGRNEEAQIIKERIAYQRERNPYYQNVLGEEAYDEGNWQQAIRSFTKAIDLRPDIEQPYFGLAKTWMKLGDRDKAVFWLQRAARHADNKELEKKYRNKIQLLSSTT